MKLAGDDIIAFLLLNTYVVILILVTEILTAKNFLSDADSRKVLHVLVGNVVVFLPLFKDWRIVVAIPAIYVVVNFLMSPHSPIEKIRLKTFQAGHSLGTVYYAISLLFLVIFFWDNPSAVMVCFLPLAYGDGMAAVFGSKKPIRKFRVVGGEKSVGGSLSFLLFSWAAIAIASAFTTMQPLIWTGFIISIAGMIVELLSPKGTDNLFIPLISGWAYFFLF